MGDIFGKVAYSKANNSYNRTAFRKNTIVLLGDSITALYGGILSPTSNRIQAESYFGWANVLLGQRFQVLNVAATGGHTTTQMLARLDTDVLSYNPEYCFVMGGINDINTGVSSETIIANLTAIYEKLSARNIAIIASRILPSAMINTAGLITIAGEIDTFQREYARNNNNFILIDVGKYFNTQTTGNPPITLSTDGTHPIKLGGYYLGLAIYEALRYRIPEVVNFGLSNDKKICMNLNPMMEGDTAGLSNNTSFTLNQANSTPSKTPRTDIAGYYQTLTSTDTAASDTYWGYTSSFGTGTVAAGHYYYAQCEIRWRNIEKAKGFKLYLHVYNASNAAVAYTEAMYPADTAEAVFPDGQGVFKTLPILVPSDGVRLISRLTYNIKGILDIGRYEVHRYTGNCYWS